MAENASGGNATTMQTKGATADSTSNEMVPEMETNIKTAEEALSPLPKKENEVTKPKRSKYKLKECSVVLEPLTDEMIIKYTTAPFPPPKQHSLRDLPTKKGRFSRFKKHREKFLKKKGRKRKISEDSLSDSLSPEQVEEEENNKKRKKVGYEEDADWSPPEDCDPVPPKQSKKKSNLRLNPRRKRIESGSSEESEGGQKVYKTRRRCTDPSKRAFLGESSEDDAFFDFLEEDAYIKEESDNSVEDPVSQLVTDIVDTVATMLDRPESVPKCRWCDTEISDALSILCPICRDMGHDETIKAKKGQRAKNKKGAQGGKRGPKGKAGIVSKLKKTMPRQQLQQILFGGGKRAEGKKFNHCRTKKTPKRQDLVKFSTPEGFEDQLAKASLAAEVKRKAAKLLKKASAKGVQKSTADKSATESEAAKVQPSSVQHGTYLLPTVPSVVVANYATSDAEKGDYFLSSLYYKNESTPSKAAASGAVSNASSATKSAASAAVKKAMSNAKKISPALTVREIIQNQLQVTPVSRTAQANSTPKAHFLSNPNLSLVPIAPRPSSSTANQQVQKTPPSNSLSMPSLSALVEAAPSVLKSSPSRASPVLSQTQLNATLSGVNPQLQISAFPAPVPNSSRSVLSPLHSTNMAGMSQNLQLIPVSKPSTSNNVVGMSQNVQLIPVSQPSMSTNVPSNNMVGMSQNLQLIPVSKPSTSNNVVGMSQNVQLIPVSQPAMSNSVPSNNMVGMSQNLQLIPVSKPSTSNSVVGMSQNLQLVPVSQPSMSSNIPSNNMVGMSQNLQLIPVSQPSMSVITKTEPDASPNSIEQIYQEINSSLLITPISNVPPSAQVDTAAQNIPLLETELPFHSDGSLSDNLISSLPFNSDVSLLPAQIDELTDMNFTGLMDNQGDVSPEKGQLDELSEGSLTIQTDEPMDTGRSAPEKSLSTGAPLESHSLKDSSSKKKEFSAPDISQSILESLKESLTLREKTLRELDAICIMCITDFDEDPKTTLLRFIESNRREQEQLQEKKNSGGGKAEAPPAEQPDEIEKKLKACERNANVYDIAWQYLKYHSSFEKYSDALLRTSRFMNVQIKKELIEQGEEEEGTSSCQFAGNNNNASNFQSNPNDNSSNQQTAAISNILSQIQSQVNNIPGGQSYPMNNMQYHGLSPVTAAIGSVDPSRETPSRGSGPRTPARPESALSQPEDMLPLAPIQDPMPMQTVTYSQNQPVNVQRININPPRGTLQFQNTNPQQLTYQRMLVTMAQRQQVPAFQAQVRSSGGKVYNVMRVNAPRMIRPSYAVQTNFVPTTAAPNQNSYVGAGAVQQNNYEAAVVPVSLPNNYGTATATPVSIQNLTPGTTVLLQGGQNLQNQISSCRIC